MPGLTQRQLKAQETKKRILDTALALFGEKGFDHVTVDEITAKSETSKGAFYVHFNSKYDIFLEKFKEIDEFYADFMETLPKEMKSYGKISLLVKSQMVYLRDSLGKDLLRTVYVSALIPNKSDYFSNMERQLYKLVYKIVEEGQIAGEIKEDRSPGELTMVITRCMRGTLYDWQLFDHFDLVLEGEKFIQAILEGIQKEI
ncbi:TetR/AcrR family transcriptional regulator [Bacillus sp. FJAT-49705]|uniref:TetR/AcrR family transcriptional regulator n=1 Tax=Cytobacillus citreus TaxID=2833586 RepID=A0ABS5NR90_9BACI|nr:TetR/AcrR family transcriptional regulator [Cytobacillus citreus]MBS4189974.1 TetR/AcrR family transcriptional regulator [Cytobacillus citreus]